MVKTTGKDEASRRPVGAVLVLLLVIVGVPALYVLSLGPVVMMYPTTNDGPEWADWAFGPADAFTNAFPALDPYWQWYLNWWRPENLQSP